MKKKYNRLIGVGLGTIITTSSILGVNSFADIKDITGPLPVITETTITKEEKTILFQDNFIHNSIKDAFLQLLMKKDYMQITITDLCKYAGVSRGTFLCSFW